MKADRNIASKNSSYSNRNITLVENEVITITKRTLRFSKMIYQTRNVTSLGEGEVEIKTIPWLILIAIIIVGIIVSNFKGDISLLLIVIAISGIVYNLAKPKHHGLLLTLNSGEKILFITTEELSLKIAIEEIYKMMESGGDIAYQISIQNSRVKGNFIQGDASGSISYQ